MNVGDPHQWTYLRNLKKTLNALDLFLSNQIYNQNWLNLWMITTSTTSQKMMFFLNGQNMGKQLQQIRFPQNFMICFFKKKFLIENICLYF
jgi:hypothetical protein